ncbi:annexin A5 [Ambystoma mexicanum]|uniref:annexin A5 n=1 Tax=Ambystoma mexicanum TaxID=8296 RepID=UPI0037E7B719
MALLKGKKGTIHHASSFNASKDADTLRTAMKGLGTDEDALLKLLIGRSNYQRQEIALAYKTEYGRDLVEDLKSELSGKFEQLLVALMVPSSLYDAYELRNAIKGAGTSEHVLIEILASRTCSEIAGIKKEYQKEYERELESDITGDTCGPFEKLLVVLVQANREPDGKVNDGEIEQDAKDLFDAGENKWGTDEEKFIRIMGSKSISHLRRVFDKYMTISGYQIEESIERETSGNFKELMLAVVKCIRSIQCYLAEVLYNAMKGAGTDDHTLIRVMVSRSEIDLWDIRQAFRQNHGQSLHSMINNDTSGDYRLALLLLCGGEDD